jgi:hypothetical protein
MDAPEIHWGKVARYLEDDAKQIRDRAASGFPNDMDTQREMRSRAALMDSLAKAIWYGLD